MIQTWRGKIQSRCLSAAASNGSNRRRSSKGHKLSVIFWSLLLARLIYSHTYSLWFIVESIKTRAKKLRNWSTNTWRIDFRHLAIFEAWFSAEIVVHNFTVELKHTRINSGETWCKPRDSNWWSLKQTLIKIDHSCWNFLSQVNGFR